MAVVDDTNHLHWKTVEVGRDFGTQMEILSGITEADQLVDNPSDLLTDGEAVKPIHAPAAPKGAAQ